MEKLITSCILCVFDILHKYINNNLFSVCVCVCKKRNQCKICVAKKVHLSKALIVRSILFFLSWKV